MIEFATEKSIAEKHTRAPLSRRQNLRYCRVPEHCLVYKLLDQTELSTQPGRLSMSNWATASKKTVTQHNF